jgi:hypothetical protein
MASALISTCSATRQLSGAIANLNCVASSILPDYDATTGLWDDRAGGWDYDYDNQGAGASLCSLDAANAHSTAAATDKEFIADFVIGTGDGSTVAFANTLPVPAAQGALGYAIQPGSLIVSVGTQASASDSPGSKKLTAAVASLLFIGDDGRGHGHIWNIGEALGRARPCPQIAPFGNVPSKKSAEDTSELRALHVVPRRGCLLRYPRTTRWEIVRPISQAFRRERNARVPMTGDVTLPERRMSAGVVLFTHSLPSYRAMRCLLAATGALQRERGAARKRGKRQSSDKNRKVMHHD